MAPIAFWGGPSPSHAESNSSPDGQSAPSEPDSPVSDRAKQNVFPKVSPPKSLELKADIQTYDSRKKLFIAQGKVELLVNGALLFADRIEFDNEFKTLHAFGSVRFKRGPNYFQASSFIYDFRNKTGELEDVYGLLELDSVLFDFSNLEKTDEDIIINSNPDTDKKSGELSILDKEKVISDPQSFVVETNFDKLNHPYKTDQGMACPPSLPKPPDWQPHPWSLTLWGGQMVDSGFGEAFVFKGRKRPEYLLGIGLQKRIYRSGVFSVELEGDIFHHESFKQDGGKFNQEIPYADLPDHSFDEGIVGIGARLWVQPWLSFGVIEGVSYYTQTGQYENTFRSKSSQLLNYLGFEIEASLNRKFSLVGRLHHRSGAFGLFDGVHGGGNGYLVGFRYRWGPERRKSLTDLAPIPIGCNDQEIREVSDHSPDQSGEEFSEEMQGDYEFTLEDFSPVLKTSSEKNLVSKSSNVNLTRSQEEALREKAISSIDQRIYDLKLNNSLTIEKRIGIPRTLRNVEDKNVFGGIQPPQLTQIGNTKFIKGRIKRWRVQATKVFITSEGWEAERMGFTNDPYTPSQARIDAEDVVAKEEKDGSTSIKTGRNQLVLEERLSIPVARSYMLEKAEEIENRWVFGIDRDDRDGFFIGRNLKPINLFKNNQLFLQPQFNFQRAVDGKTRSYIAPGSSSESSEVVQSASLSDLLGLEAVLDGKIWNWNLEANADISTFNTTNLVNGSRYWGALSKTTELPVVGEIDTRLFSTYRYRAWNGSLGETDIYSAFGTFFQKKGEWDWQNTTNSYLLRIGAGNYQAENYREKSISDLWRGNIFGSLTNKYQIFEGKAAKLDANHAYRYSPEAMIPGLTFDSNINFALSGYGDGRRQSLFGISGGPTATLGKFDQKAFSFTRISLSSGVTFKRGSSPFVFDQAIDLGTLGIGLTQQIYGPLLFNAGFEYNIDPASDYYGDVINSNIELRLQRRAYDFGIYFNPYKKIGGFRIRLNDFDFNGTGVPFLPSEKQSEPIF